MHVFAWSATSQCSTELSASDLQIETTHSGRFTKMLIFALNISLARGGLARGVCVPSKFANVSLFPNVEGRDRGEEFWTWVEGGVGVKRETGSEMSG